MGKGVYEYTTKEGGEVRWVREHNGGVRYFLNDTWKAYISPKSWKELVSAMETRPLQHDGLPIVGEVTGYRCWRVFGDELWSLYKRYQWLPGQTEIGHVGDHDGGIYAFKSPSRAIAEADNDEWDDVIAVGSVAMWGDAVEATDGWRTEYARLVSIERVYVWPEPSSRTLWQKLIMTRRPEQIDASATLNRLLRRYAVTESGPCVS